MAKLDHYSAKRTGGELDVTFGPGRNEGLRLTVARTRVAEDQFRYRVAVLGDVTVYCGEGWTHTVEVALDEDFLAMDDALLPVVDEWETWVIRAHAGDVEAIDHVVEVAWDEGTEDACDCGDDVPDDRPRAMTGGPF